MNVGSLFSGVGLMDWGLTCAGFDHAWFCEADPFCRSILERRWPGVPVYEDVRTLTAPSRVDLLGGGFPCQDVSVAGRRAGIGGERSGLWTEFARLVGELRPRYVLVENVAGLLVRGMGTVLGDLAALGYDAEWDCLPAAAFGAPHLRARIFILAYPDSGQRVGPDDTVFAGRRAVASSGTTLADAERTGLQGIAGRRGTRQGRPPVVAPGVSEGLGRIWESEPDVGRVAHGVPARVDRLRALGNGVVSPVAEYIGRRIIEAEALKAAA